MKSYRRIKWARIFLKRRYKLGTKLPVQQLCGNIYSFFERPSDEQPEEALKQRSSAHDLFMQFTASIIKRNCVHYR